ncbi:MAG: hypothetical protein LBB94_13170 [Clostridiales bacterium]|nr:hypothetical protein [Clostridiales bacterium]
MKDVLESLIDNALTGFDNTFDQSLTILSGDLDQWIEVDKIADPLRNFCYTIIGICLLIELAQVASKVDMLKWEHGLKVMVKMALSKVCIDIAPDFLLACYKQSQAWIIGIKLDTFKIGETVKDLTIMEMENVNDFFAVMGMFVSMFILILAVKLCGLIIQVVAYGRMFELYVYLVVSPVACAFFPLGNGDGGGISRITSKFFKSFAAVCLQGVMMAVVLRLFGLIMANQINSMIDAIDPSAGASAKITEYIFLMLLGGIALVMSVMKCGSWAKSILDAA